MTAILEGAREQDLTTDVVDGEPGGPDLPDDEPGAASATAEEEPIAPLRLPKVAGAATLSSLAGAWMVSHLFRGSAGPVAVLAVGVAIGVGLVCLSHRMGRPSIAQALVLPVAVAAGAVVATTSTTGRGGSLPGLVADAVREGGLAQPPIAFAPGWAFLGVVLFAMAGAAATAMATGLGRPKLAVAAPLPITLGAAVVQPKGSELITSGVAVVLVVGALALAYGADLAVDGTVGSGFEVRRLAQGAGLLVLVVVGVVALAQTDLLFPSTKTDQVIPPRKPPTPPPEPDRVLFTVRSERPGPWRLGTLDVYEDGAFLLPSVDPARMVEVRAGVPVERTARPTYTTTFSIADIKGQTLPSPAGAVAVEGAGATLQYDPRTQVFRLVDRPTGRGLTYDVVAAVPPDGRELAAAPAPDPRVATEFTAAPAPPPEVADLLAAAPGTDAFDRLQAVRQALYRKVVAAGGGRPVDVPPDRVVAMLDGADASPYEIVAAEVLLARWAGVPARMGYGFFGGDRAADGIVSFRPEHGSAFLEAYFEGFGWVPIVGTPPKAKASLSDEQKKRDPKVLPTDELGLVVFVPVRTPSIRQLYEAVRYWTLIVTPILLAIGALVAAYPAALKAVRSVRRERWARARGPAQQIAVAYAELRDWANDINVGPPHTSPLEFLAAVDDDEEHTELAWLVTRALWGDLRRGLLPADVAAAEELAASVRRRLAQVQSGVNRGLALIARTSLRDPWTTEIPNLWSTPATAASRTRRIQLAGLVAGVALAMLVATLVLVERGGGEASAAPLPPYPSPLVPETAAGFQIIREPSVEDQYAKPGDRALVADGRVFTIRGPDVVQGAFEVSRFERGVDVADTDVQRRIEQTLGAPNGFTSARIGTIRLRTYELTEQRLFLWFPPGSRSMQLWVMRREFAQAEEVVRSMIAFQRGLPISKVAS